MPEPFSELINSSCGIANLKTEMDMKARVFIQGVVAWAKNAPGLMALALVGSYARGDARPDSDVDLIILLKNPEAYLRDHDWLSRFGVPDRIVEEVWGKVTSLRVCYTNGMEVEFGLTNLGWGSDPGDEGDARVIMDGLIVLHEQEGHLSSKLNSFENSGYNG